MNEAFTICKLAFMAFVACCTLRSVGPGYANALRAEAAKVYSADDVRLNQMDIEESRADSIETFETVIVADLADK
jgi:hypothetical protein